MSITKNFPNPPPKFHNPLIEGNRQGLPLHFFRMFCRGKACPYPLLIISFTKLRFLGGGFGICCLSKGLSNDPSSSGTIDSDGC